MKIIFMILCLLSTTVFSADSFVPVDQNPELDDLNENSNEGTPEPEVPRVELVRPSTLRLYYTLNNPNFKQSGGGITYDAKSSSNSGVILDYNYWTKMGKQRIWVQYSLNHAYFQEPSIIGGKKVATKRDTSFITYQWFFGKFFFEGGLGLVSQKPSTFTSTQLAPSFLMIGPAVGVGYEWGVEEFYQIRAHFSGIIPQTFKEYARKSGYHEQSFYTLSSLFVDFNLNPKLSFSFGVFYEYEKHNFSGAGDRGVTNATNTYTNLSFPVGVTYGF